MLNLDNAKAQAINVCMANTKTYRAVLAQGLLERQTLKQQIHQTSLSDSASCSSVAPSQLRMVKKVCSFFSTLLFFLLKENKLYALPLY